MATVAFAVLTLPIKSVTVKVTVFKLTLVQLKLVLLNTREAIPQLSELPLSISLISNVPLIEAQPKIEKSYIIDF